MDEPVSSQSSGYSRHFGSNKKSRYYVTPCEDLHDDGTRCFGLQNAPSLVFEYRVPSCTCTRKGARSARARHHITSLITFVWEFIVSSMHINSH